MGRGPRQGRGILGEWARSRLEWELGKLKARFEEPAPPPEHAFHNTAIEAAFRRALAHYDCSRPGPAP